MAQVGLGVNKNYKELPAVYFKYFSINIHNHSFVLTSADLACTDRCYIKLIELFL